MSERNQMAGSQQDLRLRAEARMAARRLSPVHPPLESDRLVHELQVHQVELEMQNEELRRVETELEDSRDRWRELYEHAPVGYLTLDRTGKIVECNLTAATLIGAERGRLLGARLVRFMDPVEADAFHQHLYAAFEGTGKHTCELPLRDARGHTFVAHFDSVAVPGQDGSPVLCRTAFTDVTALRDAQDQVQAQESRLRALLDRLPDAVIGTDRHGRIESFNAAAERLFGHRAPQVFGTKVLELFAPSERRQVEVRLRAELEHGEGARRSPSARVLFARRADGSEFPVELALARWIDHGAPRLKIVLRDVTERVRAEEELRDSEARFRQIAEHVGDAFFVRELDGSLSYVSPGFERITGRRADDVVRQGTIWLDAIHDDDRAGFVEARDRLVAGAPLDHELRIRRPDGDLRHVRVRGFPVDGEHGRVLRHVFVAQDVTTKRELEERLRHAHKMEAIGTLASGIAHDFGNLLQGVLGCLHVALLERTPPERAHEFLLRAQKTASRGAGLIHHLMSFGRKRDTAIEPVRLDAVVEESSHLLERLLGEHVALALRTGTPRAIVQAVPVELERILINLATNARDAMPGGGTLTIETEEVELDEEDARQHLLARPGLHVRMVVADTGTGMNEATRRRIFDPFFTTKGPGKGTGLGLSTVFASVRELGGAIEVESAVGAGTRFVLLLPAHREGDDTLRRGVAAQGKLHGTALVVEDDPLVRTTIRTYLEEMGLHVLEARDGEHALEVDRQEGGKVALLVTDVVMPRMMGPDVAQRLVGRHPGLRVLYVSAHSPADLAERGLLTPDVALLGKPFNRDVLAARVAALLAPV